MGDTKYVTTYQIRDDFYGYALYTANSAAEALAKYAADKAHADTLRDATTDDAGVASAMIHGRTHYAVPTARKDKS